MKRVPDSDSDTGVNLSRRQAVAAGAAGVAALWMTPVLAGTHTADGVRPVVPQLRIPIDGLDAHAQVELACQPASARAGRGPGIERVQSCTAAPSGQAGHWRATVLGLQANSGLREINLYRMHPSGVRQIVWNAREEFGTLIAGSPIAMDWTAPFGQALLLDLETPALAELAVPARAGLYAAFPGRSMDEVAAWAPAVRAPDPNRPDALELFARGIGTSGQRLGCLLIAVDRIG